MKKLLFTCLFLPTCFCFSQQTINGSIIHDGLQRTYILYIPASYTAGTPAPLVINFHGYTSNANDQMYYGDFRPIADTAGFLLVHPMGTLDGQGQTYWNANWGGTVDDIGFTEALIDSLAQLYSVNLDRVYSTGMSNGGFMSYTLACSLSNRIAAIASVTGTMNVNQSLTCNPQHPMPVMEIHGTADGTVPYNGLAGSMESINNTLNYWIGFNQCDVSPIFSNVPDINTFDGCTAEHYIYKNGNNGVEIEHYKIINGAHTWPGAPIVIGTTNYDINASLKIWEFFAQYDINGKITPLGTDNLNEPKLAITIFPNPTNTVINITTHSLLGTTFNLFDMSGKKVVDVLLSKKLTNIDVTSFPKGIYYYQLLHEEENHSGKLVVF